MDERKALAHSFLCKTVHIEIDRPIGYVHQKETYSLTYPINYGYIPGVLGGDGEEMDVYLLGVDVPVNEFDAHIIAIVHRENDVEDKLVGCLKAWFSQRKKSPRRCIFKNSITVRTSKCFPNKKTPFIL